MDNFDPNIRTRTLARIVGPFLVMAALTIFVRYQTLPLLVPAYTQNEPLLLATGVFTLMAGLSMVAAHHHFTSMPAIAVSMIGLAACARGAVLMLAPDTATILAGFVATTPPLPLIVGALVLLLGAWLTYVGWLARTAPSGRPQP